MYTRISDKRFILMFIRNFFLKITNFQKLLLFQKTEGENNEQAENEPRQVTNL